MLLAIFGIDNTGLNLGITFAILALVAIWIALIVFTFSDARRRISDPFLIGCATAASFFPYVGTIVYTILRPPEFLDDVQERETEMKSAETRMRHLDANSCRKCSFPVQPDFVRCPACRTRLKDPCPSCSRPVGLKWKVCPYCEHTLIESKRSRPPAKGSSKSSSDEKRPAKVSRSGKTATAATDTERPSRRRSARSAPAGSDEPTLSDSASRGDDGGRSGAGDPPSRSGRRDTSERPAGPGREDTSERPARSATRSGRRRVVVSEDDPAPARTINGGDSKPAERKPGED
jgi:hypothetical protein